MFSLKNIFKNINTEREGEERVEHDTLIINLNGLMVEVTEDDFSEREEQQ